MSASCDDLYSTLNQLQSQLVNARHRFRPDFHADKQPLLAPFRRLFEKPKRDSSVLGDQQLYLSLQSTIKEIEDDNRFLGIFLNSIRRWTNAADVMWGLESFTEDIDAVVGEISRDLAVRTESKYMLMNPLKLLEVLENSKRKIELLKLGIEEVPDCLAGCPFRLPFLSSDCSEATSHVFASRSNGYSVWEEFEKSVQQNLRFIIKEKVNDECPHLGEQLDAFIHKLKFLQTCLGHAVKTIGYSHSVTRDFLRYAGNVVVRIAYQSCHCWFMKDPVMVRSRITALLDIQYEIDLNNPGFLEFILKFMTAIGKANRYQMIGKGDLVRSFLNYLLKWGNDLDKQLMSLVTFVITRQEETGKEVQSVVTEIKAMLLGVGFLHEPVPVGGRIDPPLCSELLLKICLLKAEASLMEQRNSLSMRSDKNQIGELFEVLNDLTEISLELPEVKTENGKLALALIEEVTMEVPLLYQSFQAQKITSYRVKISLLVLRIRIVIFKSETFLMELLNDSACFTITGKDLIGTLLLDLKLFSTIVRSQQEENGEGLESIFLSIEAVARKLTALSCLFIGNEVTEQMIKNLMPSLTDSLDQVKLVKSKIKKICSEFPVSHFPKINELGFMDFLLQNLLELLNHNPNLISPVKHHIQEIQSHLQFLRPFLNHLLKSDTLELKNMGEHVILVAYKLEYIIDTIEIGANWQEFLWFYDLLDEIRQIKLQAIKIHEKIHDAGVHAVAHISSHRISRASSPEIGETVVSLKDEEEAIRDRLLRGSSKRDIVSIVGMGGIGKTTLAKKVYDDPKIAYHFHRRAWCSVSQVYSRRELLLNIIKDIHGLPDEIHQMTDDDLELKLYKLLKKIRYLIVMDDVWDIEALNGLAKSFPDDGAGSRILLTSRFHNVALKAKPADNNPHMLRALSDDESWNLLEMKSFPKGCGCPEELVEIGKEIAHQCKGLPLAVVAISGILERTVKKQDHWENIAECLSSRIITDPETRCKDILELSYMHLPCHLKACFLYFGSFSEDEEVPVTKLIRLWIAEGFIENNGSKSLEDVAEDYLMDLIDRSLLMISKRRSNGRVKACSIHDLFRDLCLSKAQEENFLQLITRYNEPYASFDLSDYGYDFYDFYPSNPITYECHRLCIYLKRKHFVYSKPFGPCTRSLIFLAYSDTYPRRPYNVSFICHHFKLLRVLDLECINIGISFPSEIELLVQLRYLAVSGDMDSIPRSIANLRKLETFIVKGLSGKVVLPDTIWCMTRLRHLHVNNYAVFNLQDDKSESFIQLENLVSLSLPSLSHGKDAEKIIRQLPNLRKLRCVFLESWDSSMNCNQFPRLECLTELESLKIIYFGGALNPGSFSFPLNLKKLTLSNFRLPWNRMCAIGRLPKLEVLKLLYGAFEGLMWEMREDEFCKLKFLKVDTLNFVEWNASYDHIPELEQLVIRNCKNLEEVPFDFAGIPTLQMIEVQGCKRSLEESVRKIKEETKAIKVMIS